MNQYSSYKDSGVEWIGEIPSGWKVEKVKYLSDVDKSTIQTDVFSDKSVIHYSIPNVQEFGTGILEEGSDIDSSKLVFLGGELIISKLNPRKNCVCIVSDSNELIVGSGEFIPIKPFGINKFYLYNLLITQTFTDYLDSCVESVTRSHQRVNPSVIYDSLVPLPPLNEQQEIVSYLDNKTSSIDSLIQSKEKKIELLKEKRTSVINQVVTKGLNPDVEMKDSGVEWIGEIPRGWEVKKLKYVSEIVYGISPPDTTYNDEGVGTLLINGPVEYSKTDFGYTRSLKWTTDPKKFTTKGSLLFCLRGSTTGRMNITHNDVSIGRGVCSITSKENQWYLIYSMFSVRRWIQPQLSGSTFPSVTSDDVDNFIICSPPLSEQHQIVSYLDKETKLIDETISSEQKKIELLKEYKQSLISEVVTGKRKVTNHE